MEMDIEDEPEPMEDDSLLAGDDLAREAEARRSVERGRRR